MSELSNIALSLSGGGVRAVGFHLGALEMLERLGLLKKVTILSSVSGGSMPAIGYALSQHLGRSFDQYFREFYEWLPGLNTVELLLEGLASNRFPSASGRREMITVMANIYDEVYFRKYFGDVGGDADGSPRFSVLLEPGAKGSHLKEMVFNATEFQTGTAFRFQSSEYRCLIGNANIQLCREHASQIRMADIMAASSCIPAGMEPLFFPHDFHWPDDRGVGAPRPTCDAISESLQSHLHKKFHLFPDRHVHSFALMDGGVYDNQGITSVLLAMNRQITMIPADRPGGCVCGSSLYTEHPEPGPAMWAKWLAGKSFQGAPDDDTTLREDAHEGTDLIIICDTPVRKDSQYPKIQNKATEIEPLPAGHPSTRRRAFEWLTVGGLTNITWGVAVLLLITAAVNFYDDIYNNPLWNDEGRWALNLLEVLLPLAVTLGIASLLLLAGQRLRTFADSLYRVLPRSRWGKRKPWSYIKKLRVRDLWDMVTLRVGSVSALTASIFMDRIRALSYSAAYTREGLDDHIIANEIFALEPQTHKEGTRALPDGLEQRLRPLSPDAMAVIELAAHMPTKLWINDIEEPEPDDPLAESKKRVVALNKRRQAKGEKPLDDLDVLVICGQLTTCYTLMAHLWTRHRDADGSWTHAGAQGVFDEACELWSRAQDEPAVLLDERKRSAQVR